MTFRNLNLARFIGLDPIANILYPAFVAVWMSGILAAFFYVLQQPVPLHFTFSVALLVLVTALMWGDGYRKYLRSSFTHHSGPEVVPLIAGFTTVMGAVMVPFMSELKIWWPALPILVFGAAQVWLAIRMIDLSVDRRRARG